MNAQVPDRDGTRNLVATPAYPPSDQGTPFHDEYSCSTEAVGVDWITIHGRTRQQKSTEPVNLDAIKFGKEVASVPVIGNGDIFSSGDAQRMVESTGVNGVMAARRLL
ncbi:tRNA dihydrouridine synthase [Dispira simplex]|nr:tRNA dihydrouridine synthase [Dispira simplex]